MPIYEAMCAKCGATEDYYQTVNNCNQTPVHCGESMTKVILTAPMGIVDIPAYQSPIDGKWIDSRAKRREDLKKNNCREWEGMESETRAAQSRVKDEEKKQDAAIESAVVQAWHQLPSDKRKVLESAA